VREESSPYINHFIQPDSLIPNPSNPQAWNRYSYVYNNPIKYSDPTGHSVACDPYEDDCHNDSPTMPTIPNPSPSNDDDDDPAPDPNPNGVPPTVCYPGELVCQLQEDGYVDSASNVTVNWNAVFDPLAP
jgi:hypothetical protein